MEIKKGEVWKIASRGFNGVVKLLEDVDSKKDDFFDTEIVEGTKTYLNREDAGVGKKVSFRTTLTDFIQKQ